MTRVFFYSEYPNGCHYYRAEVIKRFLTDDFEVSTNVDFENNRVKNDSETLNNLFNSDIVVFIRPTKRSSLSLLSILKLTGKKIIYSTDDMLMHLDSENPFYGQIDKDNVMEAFASQSDAVLVTTDYIYDELKKINKNIYLIPNYLDFDEYARLNRPLNKGKKLKLGIVGSVQTSENINHFIQILKTIHDEFRNTELVFFGSEDPLMVQRLKKTFIDRVIFVENVPMSGYSNKLASLRLDLSLIPRKDNLFNRGKSNCKYLEMSALGIPVVAQGFPTGDSPYQKDITDGVNGFIALNDKDWLKKISKLIVEKKTREEIGQNARKYVQENFDIQKHLSEWGNMFAEVISEKQKEVDMEITKNNLKLGYISMEEERGDLGEQIFALEGKNNIFAKRAKGQHLTRKLLGQVIQQEYNGAEKTLFYIKKYPVTLKARVLIIMFRVFPRLARIVFRLLVYIGLAYPVYEKK